MQHLAAGDEVEHCSRPNASTSSSVPKISSSSSVVPSGYFMTTLNISPSSRDELERTLLAERPTQGRRSAEALRPETPHITGVLARVTPCFRLDRSGTSGPSTPET